MSTASVVGQINFDQKSGVYMPAIMCDKGDLYQEYQGEVTAPANITPDFTAMKPVLSYMLTSSRVAEGIVVPNTMIWKFNGVQLAFGSGGLSTNTFGGETGHFKFIPYQVGTANYYGLQIMKNLVKASAGASCTIEGHATVTVGNVSDTIGFTYSIPITKGVGNQRHVTIASGDNKFFALRQKGDSCILAAVARMGADEILSGLTYKWYQMAGGAWGLLNGQTAKNLTVTDGMVNTTGLFKVEVYQGTTLLGLDTQAVLDLSDPYDIITNPTPEDETIRQQGDTVVYRPILVKRGETTKAKDMTFYFVFMDSAGIILNPSTANTPSASGTCTYDMCVQAGGNVGWTITSRD
ncbi:hypothetical protein EV202_1439 [Bacteroides heparinolyticus]|uniref:Uncharacterized protein n=1 Tax=Prevotella heparinolytica TaxID=28113 RepID=A0A4R2LCR7_9BACE|nr:hypothetical protein [Bacteroides heparinolyticus]TCO86219.1 hypothetical protein EV202_1439 [Bacteroides heparinolyticus]